MDNKAQNPSDIPGLFSTLKHLFYADRDAINASIYRDHSTFINTGKEINTREYISAISDQEYQKMKLQTKTTKKSGKKEKKLKNCKM